MENLLRHAGYPGRIAIDAGIGLQSALTLLWLLRPTGVAVRSLVILGAAALTFVGASALLKLSQTAHFEGYVVVIGAALLVQAALTFIDAVPGQWVVKQSVSGRRHAPNQAG